MALQRPGLVGAPCTQTRGPTGNVIERSLQFHGLAGRFGHQHRERLGHRVAVAAGDQEPADAAHVDGGEAVGDVELDDDGFGHVRRGVRRHRAALAKAMGVRADGQLADKLLVQGALDRLEPSLRSVNEPVPARALGDREDHVMRAWFPAGDECCNAAAPGSSGQVRPRARPRRPRWAGQGAEAARRRSRGRARSGHGCASSRRTADRPPRAP